MLIMLVILVIKLLEFYMESSETKQTIQLVNVKSGQVVIVNFKDLKEFYWITRLHKEQWVVSDNPKVAMVLYGDK